MDCECLPTCLFFNDKMRDMPAIANIYKETYCRGDAAACARYIVFKAMGRDKVPPDLFPNQVERAQRLGSKPAARKQ